MPIEFRIARPYVLVKEAAARKALRRACWREYARPSLCGTVRPGYASPSHYPVLRTRADPPLLAKQAESADPVGGLAQPLLRREQAEPDVALAVRAEADARSDDDIGLLEQ